MLKLKDNIKESVSIFFERGRKVTFDINTPQEEYQYYQDLGFRIFECSECLKEFCKCPDENLSDSSADLAQELPNKDIQLLDEVGDQVGQLTDYQLATPQDLSLTQDNPVQEQHESQDTSEDIVHPNGLDKIIEKLDHEVSQDSLIDSSFTTGPNQITDHLYQDISQDSPVDSTVATGPNQTDQALGMTLEELYAMKLDDLRIMFPSVKAKTKKKFIEILHNEQ